MQKYTPMIQQYLRIKAEHEDAFLFFRLGDFYELFFEDAVRAAKELEITLTKREGGGDEPIPMCGVPHHASEAYISQLIEKGFKVAICEQVEDPSKAKGVVKREVVQVITPGTVMNQSMMNEKENNFISALTSLGQAAYGLAFSDLSTGENYVTIVYGNFEAVIHELSTINVKEIIVPTKMLAEEKQELKRIFNVPLSYEDNCEIPQDFQATVQKITNEDYLLSFGLLLNYLVRTQKRSLEHLQPVEILQQTDSMKLDLYSKRNLELLDTIRQQGRKGSLVWLLDKTVTAMGGRLLTKWIERPLIDKKLIQQRHNMVECLIEQFILREELKQLLKGVYDLERLAGKIAFGNVNARDLIQLKKSLEEVPKITDICAQLHNAAFAQFSKSMPTLHELTEKLNAALIDDPPISIREGGMIRKGFNEELDEYRAISVNGRAWIKELEQKEKEATGIRSLKIGFNRVFGYFIEVTKPNLHLLPEGRYERKQTLTNAERFVTPELKEMEMKILHADDILSDLEYSLFVQLRDEVKQQIPELQTVAKLISEIDVIQSFATISNDAHYVKPTFNETGYVEIIDGRHPVVEKVLTEAQFVENDIKMDKDRQILLITGPNMSGKSTYMRQLALIVIMAQIGCFVPATKANLPIFDQIFTRIGAADDLVSGQSTFMVEMLETRYAIENATEKSLILLDEIGRGTSTYDGMALAQAIIEHIHHEIGAKTLFSTHYHELTILEETLPKLKNIHVRAVEQEGRVVFLHKVHEGFADKSYGIHVAQLADLPHPVIKRAKTILNDLEQISQGDKENKLEDKQNEQLSFFPAHEKVESKMNEEKEKLIQQVASLNLLNMTPLEAMNVLYEIHERALNETKKR